VAAGETLVMTMDANRCPRCGRWNSVTHVFCEGCGERLGGHPANDVDFQELKAYDDFIGKHNFSGIILALILLLVSFPVLKWLFTAILPEQPLGSWLAAVRSYAPLAIVILSFLMTIVPMLVSRWQARKRCHWTLRRLHQLARERRALPRDFFRSAAAAEPGSGDAQGAKRRAQGPPVALLLVVLTLAGLVFLNQYTAYKPLDYVTMLLGVNTPLVAGQYSCHLKQADQGGVAQADQTWSYVFAADGTYVAYLDGSRQYSGTWSQNGNQLSVKIPAITGISEGYTFRATVREDGEAFTSGKNTFTRTSGGD
jgi:hypothetical protein